MNAVKSHTTPLEDRFISKLIDRLKSVEGVAALILYGSRAGGFSDEDSDLDIAVITDLSLPHHILDGIKDEIMADMDITGELRAEVFGFTEKEMKHLPIGREIEEKGVLLWKKDSSLQRAL
jgi:predicted nucleotidyltransferase